MGHEQAGSHRRHHERRGKAGASDGRCGLLYDRGARGERYAQDAGAVEPVQPRRDRDGGFGWKHRAAQRGGRVDEEIGGVVGCLFGGERMRKSLPWQGALRVRSGVRKRREGRDRPV